MCVFVCASSVALQRLWNGFEPLLAGFWRLLPASCAAGVMAAGLKVSLLPCFPLAHSSQLDEL
jgi:hypothetical protein